MVYNTAGQFIGAINSDGEWQDEDGINFTSTSNIVDPTLQKFVDKLRSFHPDYREPDATSNYLPVLKKPSDEDKKMQIPRPIILANLRSEVSLLPSYVPV